MPLHRRSFMHDRRPRRGRSDRSVAPGPFTIEMLVPMMDEAGVDRVIIVPPSWEGGRNDYALEAVRRYPARFAIMGRIPVNDSSAAKLPPDWKKQPNMLGIRLTFHPHQWHWLTDGSVDWFWPRAHSMAKATYKERKHFTEMLEFLSAQDNDWIVGRAICERLGWA